MNKETRITFSVIGGLLLVVMLAAVYPLSANTTRASRQEATNEQASAPTQSVSGTVAAVAKNSFTLTIGSTDSNQGQQMQQAAPNSMTFQIDKNTTVDGKLKVGANADVTYRQDRGNNVAVSVHVAS